MKAWQKMLYAAGITAMCWISTPGCRLATPEFKTGPQTNSIGEVFRGPQPRALLSPRRVELAAPVAPPTSVTLAWDASDDSVDGYLISQGGETGVYTNEIAVGASVTTLQVPIVAGVDYFFAARAHDSFFVASEFSNEIEYRLDIVEPPDPPEPPIFTRLLITEESTNLLGWLVVLTNSIESAHGRAFYRLRIQ